MCGFAKRKDQNLFGFLQICNGTAGKDRNSQPVYNGFLNAFQIIHPGNDVQITRDDPIFSRNRSISFLVPDPFSRMMIGSLAKSRKETGSSGR